MNFHVKKIHSGKMKSLKMNQNKHLFNVAVVNSRKVHFDFQILILKKSQACYKKKVKQAGLIPIYTELRERS